MSLVRFALYSLVGILFVTNVSQWGLVIAVVIINFISDMAGTYAGGLSAPLIVDLVGEDEFAQAEGFTNGISQVITTVAQFVGSGLLLFLRPLWLSVLKVISHRYFWLHQDSARGNM